MIRLFMMLALVLVVSSVSAQEAPVMFDVDEDRIDITGHFTGQHLVVFGVHRGVSDLQVRVEGPRHDMVVRQKGTVLGAWLNKDSIRFKNIPSYFAVAGFDEGGVHAGHDIAFDAEDDDLRDGRYEAFKMAFLRNKKEDGLYSDEPLLIESYDGKGLFRVDFYLPSNIPLGDYKIVASYLHKGEKGLVEKSLSVRQSGQNATIKQYAHDHSFFYGILCVILAVFAGWISNQLRRKI